MGKQLLLPIIRWAVLSTPTSVCLRTELTTAELAELFSKRAAEEEVESGEEDENED